MIRKLVRTGKAFPSQIFVAIGLLLCLFGRRFRCRQTREPDRLRFRREQRQASLRC